ncbi:hypothetical protein AB5J55_43865 [Streptomyces sp. R11]|uniref:Uncharacterized protein n=1 Tax=Streptomyces sp. R11 TaxID=3238625 RepID=A0AB39NC83_9ACTN
MLSLVGVTTVTTASLSQAVEHHHDYTPPSQEHLLLLKADPVLSTGTNHNEVLLR